MTCSSPDCAAPSSEDMFGLGFSFAGEIGIVSRGTGELDFVVVTETDMAGGRILKEGGGSE